MPAVNQREPDGEVKADEARRIARQRPGIAQLLLVARLRARNRRDLAVDSLERAAQVIFVTCKNWFSAARQADGEQTAQAPDAGRPVSGPEKNRDADAHRHH